MNNSLPACHHWFVTGVQDISKTDFRKGYMKIFVGKKYNQTALHYAKNICKKYVKLVTFWSRNMEKWITLMPLKHLKRPTTIVSWHLTIGNDYFVCVYKAGFRSWLFLD